MQEQSIKEQLDELKGGKSMSLNPILKKQTFAWMLFSISIALTIIDNFFKLDYSSLVGGWDIVMMLLLTTPLVYLAWKKELKNPHIIWFFPLVLLMMWDMFYYSNDLVQNFLPFLFYLLVVVLYVNSMHSVHSFYQTLLPRFELAFRGLRYIQSFLEDLFVANNDRKIYGRIFMAIVITVPFLLVFVALLFSADETFKNLLTNMFNFNFGFEMRYFLTLPLYFLLYLLLFIYGFSNHKERSTITETNALDMLIIGIFLGMINLLFLLFIAVQFPFLFGEPNLPAHTTLAQFAREGFFQLMMVMGIVLVIFLFIMRRFEGEKIATILLCGLLLQTIIMGLVSLKKMYLYQSIKGATVMRYYVEWFDYFLLTVLLLGVLFLVKKVDFRKLLNMVAILGLLTFALVISLNVEGMVASHNIEKFKNTPNALDKNAIERLSMDALPAIQGSSLKIIYSYSDKRDCSRFASYHYGYCSNLKKYGTKQFTKYEYNSYYEDRDNIPMPVRVKNQSVSTIYIKCAGCHGLKGEKPALGKSALIGGENNLVIAQKLFAYKKGELNLYGMGNLMKGQVSSLSSKDIKDLAFYIEMMGKENNESK